MFGMLIGGDDGEHIGVSSAGISMIYAMQDAFFKQTILMEYSRRIQVWLFDHVGCSSL